VPYTPQENGVSENSNRVLIERASALIQPTGASKSYWAEALQATVYLKNVSLTKGTHGIDATPLPPLPWAKLSVTPESADRKAWMKARAESDKKDEASGTVRKRRIDTERVTNLGPFWDTVQEDDRQSRVEAAESSSVGGSRSRSRRSRRGSRRDGDEPGEDALNAGIDYTFMVTNGPESINAALRGAYREEWVKAINSELDSLETHDTWTVVPATDETRV